MTEYWKLPHIGKGMLSYVPVLNTWRDRHASTGGTGSAGYCYNVWFRHFSILAEYGFRIDGACIGELGPGDSIGTGLAALLSGADRYTGLDVVPFSQNADLVGILRDLIQMFSSKAPLSGTWAFPDQAIDWTGFPTKVEQIRSDLTCHLKAGSCVSYKAPWTSPDIIAPASLDLIFSHCVLEYIDPLNNIYQHMYRC